MRRCCLLMAATGLALLSGCSVLRPQPEPGLNRRLASRGDDRSPSLARDGLAWIAPAPSGSGQLQVRWLEFRSGLVTPLPGLNRPDARPISVSSDARGQRFALVRSLDGRTELLLYDRPLRVLRPLPLLPAGVPARVALSADGRSLAVQVSRQGRWQVDVLPLP